MCTQLQLAHTVSVSWMVIDCRLQLLSLIWPSHCALSTCYLLRPFSKVHCPTKRCTLMPPYYYVNHTTGYHYYTSVCCKGCRSAKSNLVKEYSFIRTVSFRVLFTPGSRQIWYLTTPWFTLSWKSRKMDGCLNVGLAVWHARFLYLW